MKNGQTNRIYEFAEFKLDLDKNHLFNTEGKTVPLTPKEFALLLMLIENAPRAVEKNELLDAVWKDTFVEEGTLTRNISWLRKKLAANSREDIQFIETIPKRGYRFIPQIAKNEQHLIFEEETVSHFEFEEIISVESETFPAAANPSHSAKTLRLPSAVKKTRFNYFWILPVCFVLCAAAFVFYIAFFAQTETKIVLASNIRPFAGLPGREVSPSFSPDGKQIVFAWNGGIEGGNLDIYIKLVGAGDPVRVAGGETSEINPQFSPDGKSIAFVRVFPSHCEIIEIPALGGAERKIYENASYASFSFTPDGEKMAVADLDNSKNEAGIFLLDLRTGEKTRLTAPKDHSVDHTPRISPDGNSLAFIRYYNSLKREIFVVRIGGGETRQITNDDARIYGLAWKPDSQTLFFSSFRTTGHLNLWQIAADGAGKPQLITTGSKNIDELAISPDGKTFAYVEETTDENIRKISSGETDGLLIRSSRADHSPQFSPDGNKIAFASERTGNYEIWIADADGKNQRQLTASENSEGSPRFSPDSKFVAYDAQTAGTSDIYIVSTNGGQPFRLTGDKFSNALPAWSIDGKWIFFVSNRSGENQIWKIPASGGEAVQITKHGAFEMFAAPDGETVIYSKGDGKSGLWSVSVNGGGEKPLPELAGAGNWRSWTVTPRGVFYTAFSFQPPFLIKVFDFADKQTKIVAETAKPPLLYYSNLSVSPLDTTIIYASQDQNSSVILLAELNE